MKSPEGKQNVTLISLDHEFKEKFNPLKSDQYITLDKNFKSDSLDSYKDKNRAIDYLLIDTEAFKNDYNKLEHSKYIDLCEDIKKTCTQLVVIFFYNKSPKEDVLKQITSLGIHVILDRKDFLLGTITYLIRALRSRSFRTIALDDISDDFITPAPLYHFLPKNNRYIPIISKQSIFSKKIKDKLFSTNSFQIYAKQEDYSNVLKTLTDSNADLELISVHLDNIRNQYINYLSDFFNISMQSSSQEGKKIYERGQTIIQQLSEVIDIFTDPLDSIRQLSYKRWSDISHSLNCAIYTLVFGKLLEIDKYQDVAHIALFHNIGLSQIDQKIATKPVNKLKASEKLEYQKHVEYSICMLKKSRMPLKLWHYAVVYQHHECFDGSGYPKGAAGDKILPQAELLSICGAFNHILSLHNEQRSISLKEAGEILSQKSFESAETTQAFSPATLEKIKLFFNSTEEHEIKATNKNIDAAKPAA